MDAMRLCMLFFCFLVAVVSAAKILDNIKALKKICNGMRAPRHRLQLLHWFSQRVRNIDQNGILTLDSNLDPTRGDFGFHRFENRERLLPSPSRGRMYYSVGNLNYRGANALPSYVRANRNTQLREANMYRLMISVNQNHPNRVFNVYSTSHNLGQNDFNPDDTYEINHTLIEQIRGPLVCTVNQNGHIVTNNGEDEGWNDFLERFNRRHKRSADPNCDILGRFKLEIRATSNGYTKLIWHNIPAEVMAKYSVDIEICKNNHTVFNSEDECQSQNTDSLLKSQLSGSLNTSVPLNGNLQPRLLLWKSYFKIFGKPIICYGPELDDANGVVPTRIKGCDAGLQLFTEGGWACARLFIKKTFSNWKSDFNNAWVGFYSHSQKPNNGYETYKYATNFEKVESNIEVYDIYKYQSSLAIAPGVQIRFLLDQNDNNVLARTTPWEDNEKVMVSKSDCSNIPKPKISVWSSPEFFYRPEFDDANRVIPTQIKGFDASLQLYTKDGKACAQLYMKKNWKSDFYYSWVGFYSSSQKPNNEYETYQYATKFEKVEDIQDYEIYKYKSSLTIAPGVQIRFLQDKKYNSELARTPQWISA
ncbi:hypothetical protein IRJ41_008220 [Triplophysa rosa]|uniref:Uncharacterized protein n=1 Tax=Triplophysa rosa TaxID=992332 RepID=A0A9W7WWC5_TRIRA|nr:hypothetical protein IRJ41_008220 [Triplophysa rosa]